MVKASWELKHFVGWVITQLSGRPQYNNNSEEEEEIEKEEETEER